MGNAKDEFHITAIAQNPGHVTATFIVPELQSPLFARGSSEDLPFGSAKPFRCAPFPPYQREGQELTEFPAVLNWGRALRPFSAKAPDVDVLSKSLVVIRGIRSHGR